MSTNVSISVFSYEPTKGLFTTALRTIFGPWTPSIEIHFTRNNFDKSVHTFLWVYLAHINGRYEGFTDLYWPQFLQTSIALTSHGWSSNKIRLLSMHFVSGLQQLCMCINNIIKQTLCGCAHKIIEVCFNGTFLLWVLWLWMYRSHMSPLSLLSPRF